MTKTITKVGNSQGIIFDTALMDLARVKVGDQVNVTVVPNTGAIVLMPIHPMIDPIQRQEVRSASSKKRPGLIIRRAQIGVSATPEDYFHSASRPLMRFMLKRSPFDGLHGWNAR